MTRVAENLRGLRGALASVLVRTLALAAIAIVLLGPVYAFFLLDRIPLIVRGLWLVICLAAFIRPRESLLVFLAAVPLLATLPTLERWPRVSLGELWLFALLVPAWARVIFGRRATAPARGGADADSASADANRAAPRALPTAATLWLLIASCSLLAIYYRSPSLGDGAWWSLIKDTADFLRTDYLVVNSQRHFFASLIMWATLAEGVAMMWLVLVTLEDERPRDGLQRALMAMGVGAIASAAIGAFQWWTGAGLLEFWRQNDPYITRINATFSDVNAAAAYFAFMLVPVWTLARLRDDPRWRWAWRAGAALIVFALVCTASRSGWLGAVVAVGAAWWIIRPSQRRLFVYAFAASLVLLAAATAYATWSDVRHFDQRSYLDSALLPLNLHAPLEERLKGRGRYWRAAVQMIADRPIDGVGVGRYYKLVPKYLEDAGDEVIQENAHNYLLQTAAELGLIGLACFLALLIAGISAGYRVARSGDDEGVRMMAAGLTAAFIGLAVTLLGAHVLLLREGQLTFWPLVALTLLLDRHTSAAHAAMPATATTATTAGAAAIARARWRTPLLTTAIVLLLVSVPIRAARDFQQVDLSRLVIGLYDEEQAPNGSRFRWTEAAATIFVPADAATLTLPIRTIAPMPQSLTILRDGRMVDKITLADHAWHELRYVLTGSRNGERFHRFDIHVSPTWRPPNDPREIGIMLGGYRWNR
jgi:O-antigen ligase